MAYKHSNDFYKKQYSKYLGLMEKYGVKPIIKNLNNFKASYDTFAREIKAQGIKARGTITETIASVEYKPTDYSVATAFAKAISKTTGRKVKVADIQRMEHQEILDVYKDELGAYYKELQKEYLTDPMNPTKQEREMLNKKMSRFWFGSL